MNIQSTTNGSAKQRGNQQLEALLDATPFGVYIVGEDFKLRYVNPIAKVLFGGLPDLAGRDFGEVLRKLWGDAFSEQILARFRKTFETGEPYVTEDRPKYRVDLDASEFYEGRASRVELPDGSTAVICFFKDVTERKKAQEALRLEAERRRQQSRLFDGIASTTPDFVYVFDCQGRFMYANQRLLDVWGLSINEAVGKTCRELGYEQWHHDMHMREIAEVIATRKPIKGEVPYKAERTGIFGIYEYIFSPVFDIYGNVECIAGITRDVTDRKQSEQAIAEAREKLRLHAETLEATVEQRTAELRRTVGELEHFSYSITHDMRAPLRAMRSYSNLLLDGFAALLPEEGQNYLNRIAVAADRMDQLIIDALDYSKAVREEFALSPVDPAPLLQGMIESYPNFQPPAAHVHIDGELPQVIANQAGLTQCFSNLLNNAVKFVRPGQVPEIRVWAEPRDSMTRLWFEDNGIGIPREMHGRIFGMFQRLSNEYEGTGIGLALVQKVTERMGGRVGVESEPGRGSRFWLEFQLPKQ